MTRMFSVFLLVLYLDYVHCGTAQCKYEIQGIEGFHDEIKVDGTVLPSTTVFPIFFLVEGQPLSDWRHAVLQNFHEVHYFTVYSALYHTNEIRSKTTVPVGVSEVLEIGPESVNECTFYLTVTVGPSEIMITTVPTVRSTSRLMSSMFPSTVPETTMPTRTTTLSSVSSSLRTTEPVTLKACNYEIQGIDGFAGEVKVDGPIFIGTTVFSIIFLTEGGAPPDGPRAVLKNSQAVFYFTVTVNTNEIMAYRTVPVGTSEVLEIGPESVDECTFYLTVTVGPSMTTTHMSTSRLMSSLFSSTTTPLSTAMSVSQTGNVKLSTNSSMPLTTESVTLGVCKYEIQGIDSFAGEIKVDGPVFIATTVFYITFVTKGTPQPDGPRAILKNLQEVHYFAVTLNTNEIMATRTVPVGTSELLEIGPESADHCTFYLTVTVRSSMTTTLMSTSRLMSSLFPSTTTPLSTAMSVSQTGNVKLSTSSSTPWTTESVTLGVCKYEIQGIEGFVDKINVDGPVFIVTTVFTITFLIDGNPLPDWKRAMLKNYHEVQYFTVTTNTNEIMATQTVPVGTSEMLEICPENADECSFYLTVNVEPPVTTTTAKTTSYGHMSSGISPIMTTTDFIPMSAVLTVISHPTSTSTQTATFKSTSSTAITKIISSAVTPREATSKSMTSILSTVRNSSSSSSTPFTVSTDVNSLAVSSSFFTGVVLRGAFRVTAILFYGAVLSLL